MLEPIEGETDRLRMRSDLLVFRADDPPVLVLTRRYLDTLRREDGEWRFERREITPD